MASEVPLDTDCVAVGRLVEVASRTWPGINKPGGVARVTSTQVDGNNRVKNVDVQYILGSSKEKNVPVEYVTLAPQYEVSRTAAKSSLRDRSMLLGRCRRCGSLRTDCGSCDWATEEQQQQQPHPIRSSRRKATAQTSTRKTKPTSGPMALAMSSSDSEDDDLLLQELLQRNQRMYRKYLRMKSKWKDEFDSEDEETAEKKRLVKTKNRSKAGPKKYEKQSHSKSHDGYGLLPSLSSSSSEDELFKSRRLRSRRSYRHKITSVLETHTTSLEELPKKSSLTSTSRDKSMNLGFVKAAQDTTPPKKPTGRSSRMMDTEESPFGVAESSSPESNREPSFDDDNDFPMPDSPQSSVASLPHKELLQGANATALDDDDTNLALSQFIQPEGRAAAENLPDDTLDRTRTLPYSELPNFFDTMANKIKEELLPDFKLRIAKLERQRRQLDFPGTLREDNTKSFKPLLKECHQTWLSVRAELIRNGTDQCRAALRRMMDDRLYRKHRKQLTAKQRSVFREGTDARDLCMDGLEDAVETLVRKLKDICRACEEQVDDEMLTSGTESEEATDSPSSDENEYETQDLVPMAALVAHSSIETSERPLAPFHPHMHASRVKKSGSSHKRVYTDTNSRKSRKRRAKPSTRNRRTTSGEANNGDGASQQRHRNLGQAQPSDSPIEVVDSQNEQQQARRQPQSHARLPARLSRDGKSNKFSSNLEESPEGTMILRRRQSHEQEDQIPTFNLFEEEAAEGGLKRQSSPTRTNSLGLPATRRRRVVAIPNKDSATDVSIRQVNRISISQRMQDFLDANSRNDIQWQQPDEEDDEMIYSTSRLEQRVERRRKRQQRRLQVHADLRSERQNLQSERELQSGQGLEADASFYHHEELLHTNQDSLSVLPEVETVTVDDLYLELERETPRYQSVSSVGLNERANGNATVLCIDLEQNYPRSLQRCCGLMEKIQLMLEDGDSKAVVLPTAFKLLQTHGQSTLQELITMQSPTLNLHVLLLSICLRVLTLEPNNEALDRSRGPLTNILLANRDRFVDFLVLQLVDATYALLHPTAWALNINNRKQTLERLGLLRDALANMVPLTERVCRCIVNELGCQKWRIGNVDNHAFVSCVDPRDWRSFLQTGIYPNIPRGTFLSCIAGDFFILSCVPLINNSLDLRYERIGKVWPRLEVQTLWGVLAFFGAPKSPHGAKSFVRWQVIARLFSGGVLAGDASEIGKTELPPSKPQLSACEKEIGYFTNLLSVGTLDSVPNTDGVITKLILRALSLQGDDYLGNEESRVHSFPKLHHGKAGKKLTSRLWRASHPLFSLGTKEVGPDAFLSIHRSTAGSNRTEGLGIQNILLPSSLLLRRCIDALLTWIQLVPAKKVRQVRLLKSLKTFRASLMEEANRSAIPNLGADTAGLSTSFESAFAVKPPLESGSGWERRSIFFREAAALTRVVELLSMKSCGSSSQESKVCTLSPPFMSEVRKH